MTDRYCVFGNPVAHSRSPAIHARFAAQCHQDLSYEAILAPLDGFAATVGDFVAAGGKGANVTLPFKEEAFGLCTRRSTRAERAGAVNTLAFTGPGIFGDNTDGAGLVRDIEVNLEFPLAGRRVLLLGAGGAARGVIAPILERQPAGLFIANRTADKAEALARRFSEPAAPQEYRLRGATMEAHAALAQGTLGDWARLYAYYQDQPTYAKHLGALEQYLKKNPSSLDARFLLGYHYLMLGHLKDAKEQLTPVVTKAPWDTVAAQLLKKAGGETAPPPPLPNAQPKPGSAPASGPVPKTPPAPTGPSVF